MGCQQSLVGDPEDSTVEALRYRHRRPTKLKRSMLKRSSKKNINRQVTFSDVEAGPENGDAGLDLTRTELTLERKNYINERMQLFGNKASKSMLARSVDTPEAAEMEAKQGRFGSKHVFPVWEYHYNETCKCVNTDSGGASILEDEGRKSRTRLCSRCSHVIVSNKRHHANNNNTRSDTDVNGDVGGTDASASSVTVGINKEEMKLPLQNSTNNKQLATIANLLNLAALDLSAPASSVLANNRKNAWIQLAGHPGSFAPAGPKTIWKKRISKENYEVLAYTALKEYPESQNIMPAFYREVEFNGEYFIEMEDLLHHFHDPSIMDIKMGTRTFLEAEVMNPVLRKDLYEKMVKVDSSAPTTEENVEGAVTKLRYMQFREQESSTASLGFRIEAIRMSGEPPNTNLKKVKTKVEVSYFLETFLRGHEVVIPSLYERLCLIRERFESIPFFNTHEIIGSSLLIMYDNSNHASAWMIDFAKTIPVDDLTLNHRSQWKPGNHEDGYLFGLDNLIAIFSGLVEKQKDTAKDSTKACS